MSSSIYKYVIFTLDDMAALASVIWEKRKVTEYGQDLDEYELELLAKWNNKKEQTYFS